MDYGEYSHSFIVIVFLLQVQRLVVERSAPLGDDTLKYIFSVC